MALMQYWIFIFLKAGIFNAEQTPVVGQVAAHSIFTILYKFQWNCLLEKITNVNFFNVVVKKLPATTSIT